MARGDPCAHNVRAVRPKTMGKTIASLCFYRHRLLKCYFLGVLGRRRERALFLYQILRIRPGSFLVILRIVFVLDAEQLADAALDIFLGHAVDVGVDVEVLRSMHGQTGQLVQLLDRAHRGVESSAFE